MNIKTIPVDSVSPAKYNPRFDLKPSDPEYRKIKKSLIAVPSYKRPDNVGTLKYLPSAKIYVSEEEAEAYRKNYPEANIVAVHPKYQGNLCRIRNKILDDHKDSVVLIVDDDLRSIGYHEDIKKNILITEKEVMALIGEGQEV